MWNKLQQVTNWCGIRDTQKRDQWFIWGVILSKLALNYLVMHYFPVSSSNYSLSIIYLIQEFLWMMHQLSVPPWLVPVIILLQIFLQTATSCNSLRYVSYLNLWPFNFLHKPGSNILINKFIFFHGSDPEKDKQKRMDGSFFILIIT